MISMYMGVHGIYKLQSQFFNNIQVSINGLVDRVNQLPIQTYISKAFQYEH